ncbi:excinuclease ABC subunit UvrC [Prosthecobacter sp.]|uniref:excinuclease ABC subunit UvrC n=1 Tax=Prosthecobacter sp. TaxID=1965333 RepID=UPI0024890A44|nr:excinuclease ABC subunit UvrC [Prosthecobacter sp.]MDI1314226.1 excinuclease ABC subunit UvrC [Prosthecobacter sp.]
MSSTRQKPDLVAKLRDVPHVPGVYIMRDRINNVIYVGKARDLRRRLANYFTPARSKLADRKTRALIASIWDFDLHEVRNDTEALVLESKLIKEFRPRYNVSFRDDKRYFMVRVHLGDAIPRLSTTRLKKDDGARYFGPFPHGMALRTTLNWLNKKFGLRVCRPLKPGEADYKHCSNDIIKNCSAPCILRISLEDYKKRVEQACDFLDGKSKDLVTALEEEMQHAAARMDFEKAAELRDMVEDFKKTLIPTRTFERGARARVIRSINPMADVQELKELLHLERAPLVMECFDIANIGTAHCVASMVRFKNGVPDNSNYRRYRIKSVTGQNDFISMAEVIRRRFSRILLEGRKVAGDDADFSQEPPLEVMRRLENDGKRLTYEENPSAPPAKQPTKFVRLPDLVIVDGGKGQLGVAVAELQKLGLHGLPIIGLAKEHEEVYRPGESHPIIIPHERGALKLLQRIRDEAHRWANGYHQLLLGRRVAESLLDDCPGISNTRKAALLKTFGSVTRLRKATPEQIAEVPGISKVLAQGVLEFLASR